MPPNGQPSAQPLQWHGDWWRLASYFGTRMQRSFSGPCTVSVQRHLKQRNCLQLDLHLFYFSDNDHISAVIMVDLEWWGLSLSIHYWSLWSMSTLFLFYGKWSCFSFLCKLMSRHWWWVHKALYVSSHHVNSEIMGMDRWASPKSSTFQHKRSGSSGHRLEARVSKVLVSNSCLAEGKNIHCFRGVIF